MNIAIVAILTALVIAGVSGWFSVVGLMAIFSGSALSVAILGGSLEVGKLVAATLLKLKWNVLSKSLRTTLSAMVITLMLITSMGTFGYLSKAHVTQNETITPVTLQLERLDQQIQREQKIIDDTNKVVAQLDASVQTLIDNSRIRGADGAIAVRKSQTAERADLNAIIAAAQANIDKLLDQKMPLDQQVKSFETEVGPVKYIAEVIYGDADKDLLEKSVRFVTIILVLVFDPLAVLLLLAGNHVLVAERVKKIDEDIPDEVSTNEGPGDTEPSEQNIERTPTNQRLPFAGIPVRPIT